MFAPDVFLYVYTIANWMLAVKTFIGHLQEKEIATFPRMCYDCTTAFALLDLYALHYHTSQVTDHLP